MTDLSKVRNLQEMRELLRNNLKSRNPSGPLLGHPGLVNPNDPRLGDPTDPLKPWPKDKYEYLVMMSKLPGNEHLADQIDHENMRWKGDVGRR